MTVKLLKQTDDPTKIDKTTVDVAELTAVSNDVFDVQTPVIVVDGWVDYDANYVHIPVLNRYYYITHIQKLPGARASLSLAVDVLMSFATEIKQLSVVSDRSTVNSYQYVPDGQQSFSNNPQIQYKEFLSSPFSPDTLTNASKCVVVRCVAK